ncbi:DUF1748-domain-containing protein [Sporormia fimetaria CBS 119925]|uniref:DUF1748-domain-containing protein n=1 Tax=Sporormia fimetaria CBS 119925 TaxID=1340428 RepID=A0A6A6VPN3_9PLEO|nr:DUF1748-domain-containing protein [Sporormia fimetaria CBS 119925]
MVLGRLVHYGVDAVLLSAVLAGVRRSTGLTPSIKEDTFKDQPTLQKVFENYLWVGEWTMDMGTALCSSSPWFERKRP